MGRPARRPRRLDHLRHRHLSPADRARHPDPTGTDGEEARRDPRLRLGRLPLHRLRPRVRLHRLLDRRLTGGDVGAAREAPMARRDAVPGDVGEVRPAVTGPDAPHVRRLEAAQAGALRGWVRGGHRRRGRLAPDQPRVPHLLRPHHRRPGRPQLAVLDLGPGRIAGAAAGRDPRRHRRPRGRPRLRPAPEVPAPGGRPLGGADARRAAHPAPLVLPLHRLVFPVAADRACPARAERGAGPRGGARHRPPDQAASGAGTITGTIESASPDWLTSTTAPITQTSLSAVSKRVGICVTRAPRASSIRTPRMLSRDPVMPTSEMNAVPFGSTRASAVGTWVWVPRTAAARPSRCQPIATFSLVTSAWKSTIAASASERSRIASTASKGERATFSPTPPLRLITSIRIPPASPTVWPLPGLALG